MAVIDFPASPTVGQSFSAGGTTWIWDGAKWAAAGLAYLPLTGGSLTGDLTITSHCYLDGAPATAARSLYGRTTGVVRWQMMLGDQTAEDGTNAGSNFDVHRYADSGAFIDTPLFINRKTGATFVQGAGGMTVNNGLVVATPGGLNVKSSTVSGTPIYIDGPSGSYRGLAGSTNGTIRWALELGDNNAETGSSNGSNFSLICYNDAGGVINTAMSVIRSTGRATFANGLTVTTGTVVFANAASGLMVGVGSPGIVNNVAGGNISTAGGVFESGNCAVFGNKLGGNGGVLTCMQGGTTCGSITVSNASATAFNTTSDERLKTDAQGFDAGPIIDMTEVYNFEWTKAPGVRAYGVVAQEAQAVFPDAVYHDEKEDWWGVDYSKYVPLLLQELKALRARVQHLEDALAQPLFKV